MQTTRRRVGPRPCVYCSRRSPRRRRASSPTRYIDFNFFGSLSEKKGTRTHVHARARRSLRRRCGFDNRVEFIYAIHFTLSLSPRVTLSTKTSLKRVCLQRRASRPKTGGPPRVDQRADSDARQTLFVFLAVSHFPSDYSADNCTILKVHSSCRACGPSRLAGRISIPVRTEREIQTRSRYVRIPVTDRTIYDL